MQIAGGIAGAILANAMFELPLVIWSMTVHAGGAQLLSEAVATFGLLGVVIAVGRTRAASTPLAVAAYIVAAYWFTASTSFANPAVTIARAFINTFAGIRPANVAGSWLHRRSAPSPERWCSRGSCPRTPATRSRLSDAAPHRVSVARCREAGVDQGLELAGVHQVEVLAELADRRRALSLAAEPCDALDRTIRKVVTPPRWVYHLQRVS